jgi:DNA polymerase-3 subunit gamma/tau
MSYTVLARKYRPQSLDEIAGQEQVVTTLSNAIKLNRLAHAYLFAGPRGTGKTTTARILAKSLNCVKGPTVTPCHECHNCKEITETNSIDVIEIDGASNNKVDDIRDLRETVKFTPASGRYKIYIVDEVHMLTTEAFNALLKTLEEPPAQVIFIFATTDPGEIPATVLSRCQRFNFKRIQMPVIVEKVMEIAKSEKIKISREAAYLLAHRAEGSLRDVLSLLDQVVAFGGENVTDELVLKTLGLVHQDIFFTLTDHIHKKDSPAAVALLNQVIGEGADVSELVSSLNLHFRNLLLARLNLASEETLELSQNYVDKYKESAKNFEERDLLRMLKMIQELGGLIKTSDPRISAELTLLRLTNLDQSVKIEELLSKIGDSKPSGGNPETKTVGFRAPQEEPNPRLNLSAQSHPESIPGSMSPTLADSSTPTGSWQMILDRLKREKPTLGSFLQDVQLNRLEREEIHLEFSGNQVFHKQHVEKKENLTFLQKIAEEVLGSRYKIKLEVNSDKNSAPAPGITTKTRPDIEELKQKDPRLKGILDSFEGELL